MEGKTEKIYTKEEIKQNQKDAKQFLKELYGKKLVKNEMSKIEEIFKDNKAIYCNSCTKEWMSAFKTKNQDCGPSLLLEWCYAFEDGTVSVDVKWMYNKYTCHRPKYVRKWRDDFDKKFPSPVNPGRFCIAFNPIDVDTAIQLYKEVTEKRADGATSDTSYTSDPFQTIRDAVKLHQKKCQTM